jgi:proline iminopeptidase
MVEDVEAVREALHIEQMALLGHSFGGILAQAYAIKYQQHLSKLILAGTAYSATIINAQFQRIKAAVRPEIRQQIDALEREGIYAPDGGYRPEYAKLATEAQRAYNFTRPPPGPAEVDKMSWDVLQEMWVRHSDFVLDGNLSGFDFSPGLARLHVPTLIIVGEHDLIDESTAEAMQRMLPGSKLLVMRHAAHMMFVDLPESFLQTLEDFLRS